MKKVLLIGWKDLTLVLRDRAALLLMLAAPFVLTLGLGFVSGRFSGSASGLSPIPVIVVNQDEGLLGQALAEVLASEELADLLAPTALADAAAARQMVQANEATAAVIIPAGFTAGALPNFTTGALAAPVAVEVYSSPTRPVGAGVVRSVVESFLGRVTTGQVSGRVAIQQLLAHGLLTPETAPTVGPAIAGRLMAGQQAAPLIGVRRSSEGNNSGVPATVPFDVLAYFAPAMAMMFLMYTVAYGGRSVLAERQDGTLPRLLTTPTEAAQVLGGKVFGIYLTGVAQVGVLVLASSLLFKLRWGDGLGVAALVLAVAAAATGWGLLLSAFARTPAQVGSLGSALMLLFGILGGSFISVSNFPGWLQAASKITPNAWGLDGFSTLARGGTLAGIAGPLAALLVMAAVLFGAALLVFRRTSLTRA